MTQRKHSMTDSEWQVMRQVHQEDQGLELVTMVRKSTVLKTRKMSPGYRRGWGLDVKEPIESYFSRL